MSDKEILLWIQDNLTSLIVDANENLCMSFLDLTGVEKQVVGTNIWDAVKLAVEVQNRGKK